MARPSFEEIEHTADWAIRVRARDEAELLASAARGMFSLLAELGSVEVATCAVEVAVDAVDLDALLVDWLNELLFLAEERGVVFTEFEVRGSAGEDGAYVRATVRGGEPAEPPKPIKAATFGGLKVSHTEEGFEAEIVFDV